MSLLYWNKKCPGIFHHQERRFEDVRTDENHHKPNIKVVGVSGSDTNLLFFFKPGFLLIIIDSFFAKQGQIDLREK